MLPNANGVAIAFLGLQSAGRVPAMINYTAGTASISAAIRTATIRTVISSRAFIQKADLGAVVETIEQAGAKFVWLEDVRDSVSIFEKAIGALFWRFPVVNRDPAKPAVLLFTSGSEGLPKGVVLSHRNLIANAMQAEARLTLTPQDTLLNVLPVFHSFGLMAGTVLPFLIGVRLFLYPSPLHYKLIPEVAAKVKPTILVGTDTFLNGYARTAKDSDFATLRLVVAGAEAVKAETRRVWRERFGAEIVEGFGLTEASPVVAVNTAIHGRDGTVGRLMPGMRMKLEPVEGIAEGGRLVIFGPNVMMGYMTADRPGELQPLIDGWHDTGDIVSVDREGYHLHSRPRQALCQDRRRDGVAGGGRDAGAVAMAGRAPCGGHRARQTQGRAHRAGHHLRQRRHQGIAAIWPPERDLRTGHSRRDRQDRGNAGSGFRQDRLHGSAPHRRRKARA